ncbi:MAG: hydrogenase maturation protease [Candidatus Ratteibacteria bacterium]|nr:hydrogenase maturation protease [Candidatus Ratteibacteria bacterium]
MERILVIGVGSVLRGDDGVGVRVIEELQKKKFSPKIKLLSGDISGLDLLKYFPEFPKVVIIDAVDMKLKPGDVKTFNFEQIKKSDFSDVVSTHGIKLLETLTLAEKLKILPEVTVIGIQPKNIAFNLDLTVEIKNKIPYIVKKIKKVINENN